MYLAKLAKLTSKYIPKHTSGTVEYIKKIAISVSNIISMHKTIHRVGGILHQASKKKEKKSATSQA